MHLLIKWDSWPLNYFTSQLLNKIIIQPCQTCTPILLCYRIWCPIRRRSASRARLRFTFRMPCALKSLYWSPNSAWVVIRRREFWMFLIPMPRSYTEYLGKKTGSSQIHAQKSKGRRAWEKHTCLNTLISCDRTPEESLTWPYRKASWPRDRGPKSLITTLTNLCRNQSCCNSNVRDM